MNDDDDDDGSAKPKSGDTPAPMSNRHCVAICNRIA